MEKGVLIGCVLAAMFAVSGISLAEPVELSYADLVSRMIDLEGLAVLPLPGERGAMCSTYDRKSAYDEATGKYINWSANGDQSGFIRKEGDNKVIAEMEGPGCIWLIHASTANANHVKIYVDGAAEPVVDLPFGQYFGAQSEPFVYPSLSYTSARGKNLYFPIPYQKSCKIVRDPNPGFFPYSQITYSTFPKETRLPSFTKEMSADAVKALKKVDAFFAKDLGKDPAGERKGAQVEKKTVKVAAGQKAQVVSLTGSQAITALKVRMKFKDRADQMMALRKLALQITWDGQKTPAVWCPLGDFFGTAPGVNLYKSLVTGMTADGFYSYWYMPFGRSAVVELVNDDAAEREVDFEITHAPLSRPFAGLGHFHAKWHRDLAALPEDRWPDWTVLQTKGSGRFCGMMLHVWSPRGGHNMAAGGGSPWWGEGDEKFFVDGEKFPSTFGLGTEDYFGYSWCDPALFQKAYHGQTMSEDNLGHQSVFRWQIAEHVPFQKSFEGSLEKYYANDYPTLYACTAFWYLSPDGEDPLTAVSADQRGDYYAKPPIVIGKFKIMGYPKGAVYPTGKSKPPILEWRWVPMGAKLDIVLPVDAAGAYNLSVKLKKGPISGIFQAYVDDKKVGEPIDLFGVGVQTFALGKHDLTAGEHKLTFEVVGKNEAASSDQHVFGLADFELKKAE
jgi:hypothetical protein